MSDTGFGGEGLDYAHQQGRLNERDAIVRWLRAPCDSPGHDERFCATCNVRGHIADDIEQGAHRKRKRRRKQEGP